ncbi:MAG: amino acid permease [Gemella haemolysans]|uniref:APC family permease n=1 Tax=Gemella haemolysans TaxID=1379 RepID=UPI0029082562|nr:amino acid permease [Gemella haemolysans]MDU6573852.1 amino acid permease [Gemella haemolysans]
MRIFRKKTLETILHGSDKKTLKPTMRTFDLVLLGVGSVIGSGILVLTGEASSKAGPSVIFSFLIAGLACGLTALCYAELSSAIPSSGSVYTYSYMTLGEIVAHSMGWLLGGSYIIAGAAIANGWSSYFKNLLEGFGVKIPRELTSLPSEDGYGNILAIVVVLLIMLVLFKGTSSSKLVNNFMVSIKIIVIILFVLVGIFYVKPDNWTNDFAPQGLSGIMVGATTVFFAYLGFDTISTSAEETINPQKSLPRAIIVTLLICTAFYIIVCLVLTGMVPYSQLGKGDALAYVLEVVGQDKIAGIISLGAVIGLLAGPLATMFASIRILFTMSRDGLLPKKLTELNKNGVPGSTTIGVGILMALLTGFLPLGQLADLANVSWILAFTLVSYSTIVIRKQYPNAKRGFTMPGMPYLPIISILLFIVLLYGIQLSTWIIFGCWILVGLVIYFSYSMKHSVEK